MFNNQMTVVSNTTLGTSMSTRNQPQYLVIPVGIISSDMLDF